MSPEDTRSSAVPAQPASRRASGTSNVPVGSVGVIGQPRRRRTASRSATPSSASTTIAAPSAVTACSASAARSASRIGYRHHPQSARTPTPGAPTRLEGTQVGRRDAARAHRAPILPRGRDGALADRAVPAALGAFALRLDVPVERAAARHGPHRENGRRRRVALAARLRARGRGGARSRRIRPRRDRGRASSDPATPASRAPRSGTSARACTLPAPARRVRARAPRSRGCGR